MKWPSLLASLLAVGSTWSQSPALDAPAPAPSSAPATSLSDDDTARILAEITKVQKEFAQTRKEVIGNALGRFKTAAASDAEASAFYLACYRLVNIDRKPAASEEEAKERANGDWQERAVAALGEGGSQTALRLQLQLLVMLLEPRTEGDEPARVAALRAYLQTVLSLLPRLQEGADGEEKPERKPVATVGKRNKKDDEDRRPPAGRGARGGGVMGLLQRNVMSTLFAEAYHLSTYWEREEGQITSPADFRAAYLTQILPWYRSNKPAELAAVWDEYLRAETTVAQLKMEPTALTAWGANEYKNLYWAKWLDLLSHGVDATQAAANLIKVVRENPSHPSLKTWIADLAKVAEKMGGLKFGEAELSTPPTPPPAPQ